MGRVLQVLRQAVPAARPAAATPEAGATPAPEAEVPFIEVGPRKWFEASPAVLAAAPAPGDAGPLLAPPHALPAQPHRTIAAVRLRPVVPAGGARFAPEIVAYHAPDHPLSAQYRELVESMQDAAGRATLLFTAARGEAGTTTVALNVAVSAARRGRSVAIVDCNLKRPAVAQRLGLPEAPGLREVLAGAAPLEQALRPTGLPGLSALTAGLKPGPATRSPAGSVRSILAQLREQAELVLVDAPSWDGRPEIVLLGGACDAVYLVLPEPEADSPEADALCQLIPEQGARLAGCILSRF